MSVYDASSDATNWNNFQTSCPYGEYPCPSVTNANFTPVGQLLMADKTFQAVTWPCTYTSTPALLGTGLQVGGQIQVLRSAGTSGLPEIDVLSRGRSYSVTHRPLALTTNSVLSRLCSAKMLQATSFTFSLIHWLQYNTQLHSSGKTFSSYMYLEVLLLENNNNKIIVVVKLYLK